VGQLHQCSCVLLKLWVLAYVCLPSVRMWWVMLLCACICRVHSSGLVCGADRQMVLWLLGYEEAAAAMFACCHLACWDGLCCALCCSALPASPCLALLLLSPAALVFALLLLLQVLPPDHQQHRQQQQSGSRGSTQSQGFQGHCD
jgi:hypothetical protein